MNPKGSHSIHEQSLKSACFPASYANIAIAWAQNTTYYYQTANIASGAITVENSGFESPYEGRIFGVSHACRIISGSTSELPIVLKVRIRNRKGLSTLPTEGLANVGFRDMLVTNKMFFNSNHGAFYECNIPIKKGEWFLPKFTTPAWGASLPGILTELQVFIEGI
jgi:hypothetical protein